MESPVSSHALVALPPHEVTTLALAPSTVDTSAAWAALGVCDAADGGGLGLSLTGCFPGLAGLPTNAITAWHADIAPGVSDEEVLRQSADLKNARESPLHIARYEKYSRGMPKGDCVEKFTTVMNTKAGTDHVLPEHVRHTKLCGPICMTRTARNSEIVDMHKMLTTKFEKFAKDKRIALECKPKDLPFQEYMFLIHVGLDLCIAQLTAYNAFSGPQPAFFGFILFEADPPPPRQPYDPNAEGHVLIGRHLRARHLPHVDVDIPAALPSEDDDDE